MSAIEFSMDGDFDVIIKDLGDIKNKVVPAATVTALNKTGIRSKTQVVRMLSARTRIKQKLIRRRTQLYKANRHDKRIKLWFGAYGISYASFLTKRGSVKETSKGIKIGRFKFPGAFKATMPNGKTDYYQRKGKKRLPIKKAEVNIYPDAVAVMRYVERLYVKPEFKKQFDYELNRRLKKIGY